MDLNAIVTSVVSNITFYSLAAVILLFAIMMVSSKNLVHSALFMIVTFLGVAGIYVMLHADFLAVVQIMVYIGAISILLVFGVMLTRRDDINQSNLSNNNRLSGFIVSMLLFIVITRFVNMTPWSTVENTAPAQSTVGPIADLLLGPNVLPFEAAALLLLVAMVGAIILGKGVEDTK